MYAFIADVGERPSPDHRLRRLDNSKPWGPENFYWAERKIGVSSATREGRAAYMREWGRNNRHKAKAQDLKKRFGMTLDQFQDLESAQGGVCAICKNPEPVFSSLAVDHCHTTNVIRGLLCSLCNRGVGMFRDDPDRLRSAAAYLEAAA